MRIPPRIMLSMCAGPCNGQVLTTDYKKGFCITVGRTKASRLHIRDSAVSERHAEVCWTGTEWLLKDVGSSNGTVYNGRKLQPYGACMHAHCLLHGSILCVPNTNAFNCTGPPGRGP